MRHLGRVLTEILGVVDRALGHDVLRRERLALATTAHYLRDSPPELIGTGAWNAAKNNVLEIIDALDGPEKGEALAIWLGEEGKASAFSLRVEVLDLPDSWKEIQPDPDGVITSDDFQSAEKIRVQLVWSRS